MGRLTTSIAATATHADNLPGKLPNVSALDLFLPRSLASRKNKPCFTFHCEHSRRGDGCFNCNNIFHDVYLSLHTTPALLGAMSFTLFPFLAIARPKMYLVDSDTGKSQNNSSTSLLLPTSAAIGDAEIKRDSKGRLVMVRHRGSSASIAGADMITFEDVKKTVDKMKEQEGSGEKKSESGSKKGDDKKGDEKRGDDKKGDDKKGDDKKGDDKKDDAKDKDEGKEKADRWTAEEDARLRGFKSNGNGTPWKDIAADMGREMEDLKAHWKVLQAADKEGGGEDKKSDYKEKAEDKKTEGGKGKGGKGSKGSDQKKNDEKQNGGNGSQQKMDQFVFTEAQDKELRECMAAGTNWKLTAKSVHKSQDACKQRWEEIKGDAGSKEVPKKDVPKKSDETKKDEPKKDEALKKDKPPSKAASQKEAEKPASVVKAPSKAASAAGSARSTRSSIKFSISEWRALQEDEFFSFEELQILCRLIGKHGDRSWLGIASAFHDKTGRRVHPEDIREKFEAM